MSCDSTLCLAPKYSGATCLAGAVWPQACNIGRAVAARRSARRAGGLPARARTGSDARPRAAKNSVAGTAVAVARVDFAPGRISARSTTTLPPHPSSVLAAMNPSLRESRGFSARNVVMIERLFSRTPFSFDTQPKGSWELRVGQRFTIVQDRFGVARGQFFFSTGGKQLRPVEGSQQVQSFAGSQHSA